MPSFCTALRELSVSDCVNITDFGLYELAKLGATLRYLSVAKCDQVSDAGLKVIARRCYKLRYLNCRGCEAVSDDSIIMLAHSCARIRALDIGKCDVSDAGLHALAESCPNLKKISLRNCDMITDRGIQCIAYYCRGLQHLNIQDCQISVEGYRAVKMYCKRCVIEHTNPGFGWCIQSASEYSDLANSWAYLEKRNKTKRLLAFLEWFLLGMPIVCSIFHLTKFPMYKNASNIVIINLSWRCYCIYLGRNVFINIFKKKILK